MEVFRLVMVNTPICQTMHIIYLNIRPIDDQGIRPSPAKVRAIENFPMLKTLQQLNFYRWFEPHTEDLLLALTSVLTGQKRKNAPIQLQPSVVTAFQTAKQALASAVLLNHLDPKAPISVMIDASSVAISGTLQQTVRGVPQLFEFFAQKLSPTQRRYSTFSRELLAIYAAIKHFLHLLEGRNFTVFTDHKPLTFALKTNPRELRQLDFVSVYTTDIQYVPGPENPVADALSSLGVESISTTAPLDFEAMASARETDTDLVLEKRPLLSSTGEIWCDTSTGFARPVVPQPMRKTVFEAIHNSRTQE